MTPFEISGIRGRVLILALAPLLTMAMLLGYYLIDARLEGRREVLLERGNLVVRHLALASEFGLQSRNNAVLDSLVGRLVFSPEIAWAAVLDRERRVLSGSGAVDHKVLKAAFNPSELERYSPTLFIKPIGASMPHISGPEELAATDSEKEWPLGWVVVKLSLKGSLEAERSILHKSLTLILIGLGISVLIALKIGSSITDPVFNLVASMELVRRGKLTARVLTRSSGELGVLETGFNEMAAALQKAQSTLEHRVEAATAELQYTVETLQKNNQELEDARQAALDAGQEKADFLARMSHEIRTPLSAVTGFSRLLVEGVDPVSAREHVDTINCAANQLSCVIDGILDFTRLESGRLELESIPFDLRNHLEHIVAMMGPAANEKGLELVLMMHADLPRQLKSDPNRLGQVLTNLLNNAIKFTEAGHVYVEATRLSTKTGLDQVWIEVSDTGVGLSAEEQGRLFQAFAQAENSVSRRFGGTGLGLAICKLLTQLMGGVIGVSSDKGHGSVFHFTVPCNEASEPLDTVPDAEMNGRQVLLHAPHHLTRRALRSELVNWGCAVFNTGTGQGLLSMLSERARATAAVDLVIMDCSRGHDSGSHICRLFQDLRQHYYGPVLILAGSELWKPPVAISQCPRVAWIAKPVRRAALLHRMRNLLGMDLQQASALTEHTEPVSLGRLQGLRILVAEDNAFNRSLLRHLLVPRGVELTEAVNGDQAIKQATANAYDLILMDIHMPEIDGLAAAKSIRSHLGPCAPPIFALTADVFQQPAEACEDKVFDRHLLKPFSLEALEKAWSSLAQEVLAEQVIAEAQQARPAIALLDEELRFKLYAELNRLHAELVRSVALSDWGVFSDIAHQLRGLSGLHGLTELKDKVAALERSVHDGELPSVPEHIHRLEETISSISGMSVPCESMRN